MCFFRYGVVVWLLLQFLKIEVVAAQDCRTPIACMGNEGVVECVNHISNSIGYAAFDVVLESPFYNTSSSCQVHIASIENKAGHIVNPSISSIQAAVRSTLEDTTLCDGFGLCAAVHDAEDPDAWPIAAITYLVVPLHTTSACGRRLALLNYVKFILLDPQVTSIARKLHWAQVPRWLSIQALALLQDMTCEDGKYVRDSTAPMLSIEGSGSSMQHRLQLQLSNAFFVQTGVQVRYDAFASGVGQANLIRGLYDFAASETLIDVTDSTVVAQHFQMLPLFAGGIVVVYNRPSYSDLILTRSLISRIFLGNVSSWDSTTVVRVVRGDVSGTTQAFMWALYSFQGFSDLRASTHWPPVASCEYTNCTEGGGGGINPWIYWGVLAFVLCFALGLVVGGYCRRKDGLRLYYIKPSALLFETPPVILGSGACASVFQAEYKGTKVAIKLFHSAPAASLVGDFYASLYYGTSSESTSGASTTTSRPDVVEEQHLVQKLVTHNLQMWSMIRHPCVVGIMGVVAHTKDSQIVMEFMEGGTLKELLHNRGVHLDPEELLSMLMDVSRGLQYLHESLVVHGDLKPDNVLLDFKLRAKVTDFGLAHYKKSILVQTDPYFTAPELLRLEEHDSTVATDVFSFGVLIYEVFTRVEPYVGEDVLAVVAAIKDMGRRPSPILLPPIVLSLAQECWDEDPHARPPMDDVSRRLRAIEGERMDSFATKSLSSLPRHLTHHQHPEHKAMVSILFSDIVGFTTISSDLTSAKVSDLVTRLVQTFDTLTHKYGVFHLETIGDAYIAATNLLDTVEDHASRLAHFAMQAVQATAGVLIDPDIPSKGHVQIRVGLACGPVTATVLGTRRPKYTLLGDTMNLASRMESTSLPGCIQCSEAFAELLDPQVSLQLRGEITIKGKGRMRTFWIGCYRVPEDDGPMDFSYL